VSVLGGDVAWHVEFDKAPSAALAHRFPGVPNYGDVTAVDWAAVEPVDVLTGGFPCQDLSHAGKRAGLRPGTRSGLWEHMAYAISELRPRLVVIENVRGLLSAEAHSDVEPCPWCVGDGSGDVLRALGAVLGDLAGLGYDAVWGGDGTLNEVVNGISEQPNRPKLGVIPMGTVNDFGRALHLPNDNAGVEL
jgi:DNA (cytosine-5)-methyltransferase 1